MLISAQANLAGMYPPIGGNSIFNVNLNWQPIPVHTQAKETDAVIYFNLNLARKLFSYALRFNIYP